MMKSVRFRRAFRLMCAVGILEGAFYFFEMLNAGDRLGNGAATGHSYVTQRVFGLIIFVGTRNGYYSNLSSVAWVVPVLLAIPLIIALVAYTVGWQSSKGSITYPKRMARAIATADHAGMAGRFPSGAIFPAAPVADGLWAHGIGDG